MLTHRNLGSNALALVDAWGFTRGDVLLHALRSITCTASSSRSTARCSRRADAVAREIRSGAGACAAAARHGDDGRPDVLQRASSPIRRSAPTIAGRCDCSCRARRRCCRHVRGIPAAHGPHDPRALWNVRDRDEHVESARRRADRRHRGPPLPGVSCGPSATTARRSAPSRRQPPGQGTERLRRLLRMPRRRARSSPRRLVPHRRRGRDPRQRYVRIVAAPRT